MVIVSESMHCPHTLILRVKDVFMHCTENFQSILLAFQVKVFARGNAASMSPILYYQG